MKVAIKNLNKWIIKTDFDIAKYFTFPRPQLHWITEPEDVTESQLFKEMLFKNFVWQM